MMDKFTRAYIACALWASYDDTDTPLDSNYDESDIASDALASIEEDCMDFQASNADILSEYYSRLPVREWSVQEQAGHDFWLTRNHHGAGFWDRGLGELGQKLTEISHVYGSVDLYVGDDGMLHIQ